MGFWRNFDAAAEKVASHIGGDVSPEVKRRLASDYEDIYRELDELWGQVTGLRALMLAGSVPTDSDEEPDDVDAVFKALGRMDVAGYSGTVGAGWEKILARVARVRAFAEGAHIARVKVGA